MESEAVLEEYCVLESPASILLVRAIAWFGIRRGLAGFIYLVFLLTFFLWGEASGAEGAVRAIGIKRFRYA